MSKGLSQLISLVLVTLITVVGIASVNLWGRPALDAAMDAALLGEAQRNMAIIDGMVRQAASEGDGVVKRSTMGVTDGTYRVNATSDSITYEAEARSDSLPAAYASGGMIRLESSYADIDLSGDMRIGRGSHGVCVRKQSSGPSEVSVNVTSC